MKARSKKLISIGLALALLIAIAVLWLLRDPGKPSPFPFTRSSSPFTIVIKTNGLATFWGVPLGAGSFREATFRVLRNSGLPVRVNAYIPQSAINPVVESNLSKTFQSLNSAGLIAPSPKAASSSQFE